MNGLNFILDQYNQRENDSVEEKFNGTHLYFILFVIDLVKPLKLL